MENTYNWENEFDSLFNYASFTWNGDNATGVESAKEKVVQMKSFITHVRNQTLEEAAQDCLKNKVTCPCGKYCVQDGRNEGIEESVATIKSLKK